ncbi:MAG TPA: TetR/AcrR family transcriptional regulator [Thermoanaerobaculia bacterium]|nr:TetR/AcrR family transcriptional regulator [Thermoanaerobaculia bacterium]
MDPADQQPDQPQPAARRGRADHKESVRRVILDAARELFVCEGYGNVSLRKIAQRIGYTPMAIYVHFRDKSEILDCICEESFSCFRANTERLDQLGLPPRERLAAGLRFYIDFGLEHPHHYQLTFMTPPCGGQSLGRRKEIGQDCYQRMRRRVALCMAGPLALPAPQIPPDSRLTPVSQEPPVPQEPPEITALAESPEVELASQAIWTAMHGLVSLLIARPEFPWLERERLIETVIDNALRTLRPAASKGAAGA